MQYLNYKMKEWYFSSDSSVTPLQKGTCVCFINRLNPEFISQFNHELYNSGIFPPLLFSSCRGKKYRWKLENKLKIVNNDFYNSCMDVKPRKQDASRCGVWFVHLYGQMPSEWFWMFQGLLWKISRTFENILLHGANANHLIRITIIDNIIDDFLLNEIVLNYWNIENYALSCSEWITPIGPNLSRFCDVIGRDYVVAIWILK